MLDVVQEAAFTGELTIRELVDLHTAGQPVVARGRRIFITVDPTIFDQATQQLPAPPDEGR